jgi:imidazolonepropionase
MSHPQSRKKKTILYGPFSQVVTLRGMPLFGPASDALLEIVSQAGIWVEEGRLVAVGSFQKLARQAKKTKTSIHEIKFDAVVFPGFVDAHTHICFEGLRVRDYQMRVSGSSYLDIAKQGGGILDTVRHTRAASKKSLVASLLRHCWRQISHGVTTCEVKSGYGLTLNDEIKMLTAIADASSKTPLDLIPSCLAAHVCPPEFSHPREYLEMLVKDLLPLVKKNSLAERIDIFVEEGAFSVDDALWYLSAAKKSGFDVVVHADQFHPGGSHVAAQVGAVSADHLEASGDAEFQALAKAGVVAVVLPGATLGLGMPFAPARQILDAGLCLAIASDWNPGSAPMGDLLTQVCLLGAAQKLSLAETLAGMTNRAAHALKLSDRGVLDCGLLADFVAFPTQDYREVFAHQGQMQPSHVWKRGKRIINHGDPS